MTVHAEAGASERPLVSVVIPCYRQAHFLPEAIESVLAQTYPRFQIIVVDDGSPDDTAAVVTRYDGVRCIRQSNQGLSAARNTGIGASTGTYLVCLDADDRLKPGALAMGVRQMEAHPECALVAGEHQFVDEGGSVMPSPARRAVSSDHYRALLESNFIWCPATVMYRRSVLEQVGRFDVSLRSAEDYDLYLRIASRFSIRTHTAVVADYRLHRSAMSRNPARMLKFSLRVLQSQLKRIRGNRAYEEACIAGINVYRELYGTMLIQDIAAHLRGRAWRPLVQESLAALRYHPRAFASLACRRLYRSMVEARS